MGMMVMMGVALRALIFTLAFSTAGWAGEITGTQDEIKCVHENLDSLSVGGIFDPILIDVPGCRQLFKGDVPVDTVHAGHGTPVKEKSASAQRIEERTELTIAEAKRIACKLSEWSLSNPNASADAVIKLDLSSACNV